MKKNKLAIILFVCGIVLITFPMISQKYFQQKQQQLVDIQLKEVAQLSEPDKNRIIEEMEQCNENIFTHSEEIGDPFAMNNKEHKNELCEDTAEEQHFSSLEIPKLNEKIPIYIGASQDNLAKGVGQVEGSSLPNGGVSTHSVLAGHRGMWTKAMFRHLDELQPGDYFYVYTLGERRAYVVYDVQVILPHQTESLTVQEGKDLVSLITCHPYGNNTHRLVVYGEREKR